MYQKFKDCLLRPRNISKYVNEKKSHTWIYFFILLFIYCLPNLTNAIFVNTIDSSLVDQIVDVFEASDKVNYKIEDYELKATSGTNELEIVNYNISAYSSTMDVCVGFTLDETKRLGDKTKATQYLGLTFLKDRILVGLYVKLGDTVQGFEEGFTYEKLGFDNLDFSRVNDVSYNFDILLGNIINNIYKTTKNKFIVPIILIILIACTIAYLLDILFITLLEKLFFRRLHLGFKIVFKVVLLCSTPLVIFEVLYAFTGISIFYILGDLLLIFYSSQALMSYKLVNINLSQDGVEIMPGIYMKKNNNNQDNNTVDVDATSTDDVSDNDNTNNDLDDDNEEDK